MERRACATDSRRPCFTAQMTDARSRPAVCLSHRTRPRPSRRDCLAALALAAMTFAAAAPAKAAPATTLIVEGAGEGHGVGMSQDGALGMALHGASDRAILAHYYTGTTIGAAPAHAVVRVLVGSRIERVPLERYVRGVVAAEMPANWPASALEAQAIASRTYALTSHAGGSRFDVYSDTRSQVYLGVAAETARTDAAVAATAGQIVTYAGRPATTYFFASSGGMTESIQNSFLGSTPEPWLVAVADPYEGASSRWRVTMSFANATARLRGFVQGALRGIEVIHRGVSPRVVSALVLSSRGNTQISGPELATRLGLPSAWAYFSARSGSTTRREPDLSGRPPQSPPVAPGPSEPEPSAAVRGGTPAVAAPAPPVSAQTASAAGGVAAG
jgi:SpoIID/LytB domain protein